MPNLAEVKTQPVVAEAFLKRMDTLNGSPDNFQFRLAAKLKDATEANWPQQMAEARQKLRAKENRISVSQIENKVLAIDPDAATSPKRDGIRGRLVEAKDYAEKGTRPSGAAVEAAVNQRMSTSPTFKEKWNQSLRKGSIKQEIATDPRYRRQVQERLQELTDGSQFEEMGRRVATAQGELQQRKNERFGVAQQYQDAVDRKFDLKQKRDAFDSKGDPKNTEYMTAKTAVDAKSNVERVEYKNLTQSLQQQEKQLADLENRLKNPNFAGRGTIDAEATRVRGEVTRIQGELQNRFADNIRLEELDAEKTNLESGIKLAGDEEVALLNTVKQADAAVLDQESKVLELKSRYSAIESDYESDVQDIYGWAAEQYLDEREAEYMAMWDEKQTEFVSAEVKTEWEALQTKLHGRWYREKKGFEKVYGIKSNLKLKTGKNEEVLEVDAVNKDLRSFILDKDGPKAFLAENGITDPKLVEELTPLVGTKLVDLGVQNKCFTPEMASKIKDTPWAKGKYDELLKKDTQFSQSLEDYKKGNRDNTLWLTLLMAGIAVLQTVNSEAENSQAAA